MRMKHLVSRFLIGLIFSIEHTRSPLSLQSFLPHLHLRRSNWDSLRLCMDNYSGFLREISKKYMEEKYISKFSSGFKNEAKVICAHLKKAAHARQELTPSRELLMGSEQMRHSISV